MYKRQVEFLFGAISCLTELDGKIRQSSNQRLLVELGLMKIAGLGPSELMEFIEPEVTGTPSITYSGELEALKRPLPQDCTVPESVGEAAGSSG